MLSDHNEREAGPAAARVSRSPASVRTPRYFPPVLPSAWIRESGSVSLKEQVVGVGA